MTECWIPEYVECGDLSRWGEYEDLLYSIFQEDFIKSRPDYRGKRVAIRRHPVVQGREEAFWHLTCSDYGHKGGGPKDRDPDLERCRRIRWPRAFIECSEECGAHVSPQCQGVVIWSAPHKSKGQERVRVKMFLEEESYLVVLEPRDEYCLLITAYYVNQDWSIRAIKREAAKNGAINAGSAS